MTLGQKIALTLGAIALAVIVFGLYAEKRLDHTRQSMRRASERWEELDPIIELTGQLISLQAQVSALSAGASGSEVRALDQIVDQIHLHFRRLVQALEDERSSGDGLATMEVGQVDHLLGLRDQLIEAARAVVALVEHLKDLTLDEIHEQRV